MMMCQQANTMPGLTVRRIHRVWRRNIRGGGTGSSLETSLRINRTAATIFSLTLSIIFCGTAGCAVRFSGDADSGLCITF